MDRGWAFSRPDLLPKNKRYPDTVWRPATARGDLKPRKGSGIGLGLGLRLALGLVDQAGAERRAILKLATSNLHEMFHEVVSAFLHF